MNMENFICDHALQQLIKKNLNGFDVHLCDDSDARKAAVALTVVDIADDPGVNGISMAEWPEQTAAVVLTRRSARLKNHTGQWALPGGSLENGESPETAALRELEEEVGADIDPRYILGRLDDYQTRSGFVISPIVVWGGCGLYLAPNPGEVASIHRIPIAELMRKDAPQLDDVPKGQNPVLRMPIGYSHIASPTGALLYQFREVALLGRKTRVAHFEQPFFAWQ